MWFLNVGNAMNVMNAMNVRNAMNVMNVMKQLNDLYVQLTYECSLSFNMLCARDVGNP